jgi:hypothetical protein
MKRPGDADSTTRRRAKHRKVVLPMRNEPTSSPPEPEPPLTPDERDYWAQQLRDELHLLSGQIPGWQASREHDTVKAARERIAEIYQELGRLAGGAQIRRPEASP